MMSAEINKIIKQLRDQVPNSPTEKVEKSFNFLNHQLENHDKKQRQEILTASIKSALNYSLKPILPEFISAIMLHPLLKIKPEISEPVKKELGIDIFYILKAYNYANQHLSGIKIHERDMFCHTLNTTLLLAESKLNFQTITASLLKHLPEFTSITAEKIKNEFNEEILNLIEETNQLLHLNLHDRQKSPANLRLTVLFSVKDLRAILIKICSLIDLLKNAHEINPHLHQKIALEAMNIYAPIADILGSWRLKWQLEDYSFKILQPNEYAKIAKHFNIDEKKNREKYIEKTKKIVMEQAKKANIVCSIDGRFKHFYSIYNKMQNKKKKFNEIYDVFALRVIVPTIDDCYRMLGIIHSLWKPKPRRVKDYIACPKTNNYRSLHTTVFGLNGRMTEFQIRTKEMDDEAKYGVAAHWYYKNQKVSTPAWIKFLIKKKKENPSKEEFFQKLNQEILNEKIFVYTPKEEVIILPKGSTPLDFAYAIHSEIGNHYVGAQVNGNQVEIDYQLKNEDTVTINTDNKQIMVKEDWLKFIKTDTARRQIRLALQQYVKENQKNKLVG